MFDRFCSLCGRHFDTMEGAAYEGDEKHDLCHPADSLKADGPTCYEKWTHGVRPVTRQNVMRVSDVKVKRESFAIIEDRPHGVFVADLPSSNWGSDPLMRAVRERTSDDWWASAIEHIKAGHGWYGISPLGGLVNLLADDDPDELVIPADVRQRIEDDAYEAAREVIADGIAEHLAQMARNLWARDQRQADA